MQFSRRKTRLRSSYPTLCRNTLRRRWRSETVASNSSHFESHAVSKHVATTLTSGAPGRKNVETTASIGVPRIFPGSAAVAAGQSIRRPRRAGRRVGLTEGANMRKVLSLKVSGARGLKGDWGQKQCNPGYRFRPPSESGNSMIS